MNAFAKLFVAANRITGAFMVATGTFMLVGVIVRLVRGGPDQTVWTFALLGTFLAALGTLYLRAPLSRQSSERKDAP